jgi:predicted metal-dependent phosphoesterase TrpH
MMKRYDLHIHTNHSPCSLNKPETILERAKKKGLDGIAITDHHLVEGAYEVRKLNKDKDFEIIIGEEIRTEYGDVVALYINELIETRKLLEVIDEVKKQDGLLFVAHPYRITPWQRFKYPLEKLQGKVHAVETFNSRNIFNSNKRAEESIKGLRFAKTGGSDAHIPQDVGNGITLFEGDLRKAIKMRKTKAEGTTRYALLSGPISFISNRVFSPLGVKRWL